MSTPAVSHVGRALLSAWRGACWVGRGLAALFSERPVDDWLTRMMRQGAGGPLEGEIRRFAAAWRDTFCGACAAGPEFPQARCPKCLQRLARILQPGEDGGAITPIDRP
jgi:hypothetical protein